MITHHLSPQKRQTKEKAPCCDVSSPPQKSHEEIAQCEKEPISPFFQGWARPKS